MDLNYICNRNDLSYVVPKCVNDNHFKIELRFTNNERLDLNFNNPAECLTVYEYILANSISEEL